jgi:hypothetical protein
MEPDPDRLWLVTSVAKAGSTPVQEEAANHAKESEARCVLVRPPITAYAAEVRPKAADDPFQEHRRDLPLTDISSQFIRAGAPRPGYPR